MSKPSWIGVTLNNRYRIDETLGQGGMSAVFKATDPNLKRVVAIKLIHPHLAENQQFVYRFEEEAAAVAKLRHPNIVQVYDFDHDDDTYYMVLEFVAGESLNQRVRRLSASGRQIPLADALLAIAQVCDAVDYAHKRGLVHRDIKPANIMIDVQGQAILMDFGIVKIVGGEKHTATGAVVGTAHYMAPEQVKGENADFRADIYSIGVTLFEILSGRPPYTADSVMTIMMMHLTDPIPDISAMRNDVPASVKGIIEKAMAKDPADRYQSAAEMAADLRGAIAQAGSQPARPANPPTAAGNSAAAATQLSGQSPAVQSAPHTPAPPLAAVDSGVTAFTPPPPSTGASRTMPPPSAMDSGATINAPTPASQPGISYSPASSSGTGPLTPPPPSRPVYIPAEQQQPLPAAQKLPLPKPLMIGGAIAVLVVIILIAAWVAFGGSKNPDDNSAVLAQSATQTALALAVLPPTATEEPTATITHTATPTEIPPTPTETIQPTITNTLPPSPTPTITVPPGIPFVRINGITISAQNRYVVEYETFEYTEQLPGMHIHFFFNTVTPENAGSPGSGPWILYGGPRPFTGYRVSDKPAAATHMCALVANANHSIQLNSGHCFILP